MTLFWLLFFLVIEGLCMLYAALNPSPYRMRGLIAINMILISLFAPKLFSLFGYVSNLGNILYSSVFLSQAWIAWKFGREEAYKTIPMVLYTLTVTFVLSFCLSRFPDMGEFSSQVTVLTTHQWQVIFASYWAFVTSQMTYGYLLTVLPVNRVSTYIVAIIIGQAIDSLFFFPIAFYQLPLATLWEISLVGFGTKVIAGLLLYPFLCIALNCKAKFSPTGSVT